MFVCVRENREQCDYPLTTSQLELFNEKLFKMITDGADRWDESIWAYEEMLPALIEDFRAITWVIDYMKKHKEVEVKFYDSY